jgi:hypothetical protein
MQLQPFIDALEDFSALHGVTVFRTPLSPWVVGHTHGHQLVLRSGLNKEQQLLTLIHELTHFLAHPPEAQLNRTVCEYEAEAVEKLVGGYLGLKHLGSAIDPTTVTDDLLACSVERVRRVARSLLGALQAVRPAAHIAADRLQAQPAIEIETAPGEEIVFDDELGSMRDLVRLAQSL